MADNYGRGGCHSDARISVIHGGDDRQLTGKKPDISGKKVCRSYRKVALVKLSGRIRPAKSTQHFRGLTQVGLAVEERRAI